MVFPLVGLRELSWSQWLRDEQVTWQGLVGTGVWGKEVWQDRLRSHRAVAAVFWASGAGVAECRHPRGRCEPALGARTHLVERRKQGASISREIQ